MNTKNIGKLAAKEIFRKSKGYLLDPSHIIKKIITLLILGLGE